MTAVIGETKASSFFVIFHHIGQRLGRYRCHFGSNVVIELLYSIWLVGINLTLQKSRQKEFRCNQIRKSWWPVNITFFQHHTSRDIDCPPRSPDLTTPDFFFSRFLKSKIYANKPKTIEELKHNIRGDMAEISLETLVILDLIYWILKILN